MRGSRRSRRGAPAAGMLSLLVGLMWPSGTYAGTFGAGDPSAAAYPDTPPRAPVPGTCVNEQTGTDGPDTIIGSQYGDRMYGLGDEDDLRGANGEDCLYGGDDNDRLAGNAGADRLYGGLDNDTLIGATGHDRLFGGHGNDVLYGGDGNDRLDGGVGNDSLVAGPGLNVLIGGGGDDGIDARNGSVDIVVCGVGLDTARAESIDRINDAAGCEMVVLSEPVDPEGRGV